MAIEAAWLAFECPTCRASVPARSGESPRRASVDWTLACPSCHAVHIYRRGTAMVPLTPNPNPPIKSPLVVP